VQLLQEGIRVVLAVFQEPDDFAGNTGQRGTGVPDLGRLFRTGIQDVNRLDVGNHTPCPSLHITVKSSQRAWSHASSTAFLPHRGVATLPAPAGLHRVVVGWLYTWATG
jgi:hypothetical protein